MLHSVQKCDSLGFAATNLEVLDWLVALEWQALEVLRAYRQGSLPGTSPEGLGTMGSHSNTAFVLCKFVEFIRFSGKHIWFKETWFCQNIYIF